MTNIMTVNFLRDYTTVGAAEYSSDDTFGYEATDVSLTNGCLRASCGVNLSSGLKLSTLVKKSTSKCLSCISLSTIVCVILRDGIL